MVLSLTKNYLNMKNNSTYSTRHLLRNRFSRLLLILSIPLFLITVESNGQTVTGELRKWHNATITFDGPSVSESGTPNPFMDYRLNVTFTKGARTVVVPGYYAADGNAANSSATSGNKWRVHFAPDETGTWHYTASFRQGTNIAASTDAGAGTAVSFDGANGSIVVLDTNKSGVDFRSKGWLRYVGKPYPQFDNGDYFIRAGPGGPENFLGYEDFDNTPDLGYRHDYGPHVSDHNAFDDGLLWNGKGKGILGLINYIADQGMNTMYFVTHTTGGDTKDTFPWTGGTAYSRYDVSKLAQWEIVFEHMTSKGVEMHLFFNEEENDLLINGGALGNERKVYYREMIARFGHHLAVTWNLGEEINTTGGGRPSDAQIASYCSYIRSIDPYVHPIAAHCADSLTALYTPLLGNVNFEMATIQTTTNHYNASGADILHTQMVDWRAQSAAAGRPWIVTNDEQGGWQTGLPTDASDPWHPEYRRRALWGALMAGGGIAYYWNGDVTTENLRPFEQMWQLTALAERCFQAYLPFEDMVNADSLTTSSSDYVLAQVGDIYAIYLPNGGSTNLNLSGVSGTFDVQWFNPRNVNNTSLNLETGSVSSVTGGGSVSIGNPPSSSSEDWLVIVGDTSAASGPSLQSLQLIDATTDQVLSTLSDGMTINFAVVGNQLSVNAVPGSGVQSVHFNLDSGALTRTESGAPYSINGDTGGDYAPWTPALGNHILVVTPYSDPGASGIAGTPITVNFTVINQAGSAPSAPSGLTASAVSSSQISLSWNDNSSDESGFKIERSNGGSFAQIDEVGAGVTGYSDLGLSSNTAYTYRVSAYNGFGTSAVSNESSATTSAPSGPEFTHLNLMNATTDQVISQLTDGMTINLAVVGSSLNVDAVAGSGVESVKFTLDSVFFRKENGAPYAMNGDNGAGDFYDWTPALGSHTLEVIPYSLDNFGGTAGAAVTVNFTVTNQSGGDAQAPSVPAGLASSNITSSSVNLNWNASSDNVGVTGYNVYTNGSNPVSVSGPSVTMTGLSASTSYTFTVSAYDAASNESAPGSGINVTTQASADTQAPSVPTGLASSNVTSSSVVLNWNASNDNVGVTGYYVYTNGSNPVSASGTSKTISGLSASTSYTFTVSAYDAATNESAQSSSISVTTLSGGGTPGLLNQSQFSIHWVDSEETVSENSPASNAIDGNAGTYWHSQYNGGNDPKPNEIQIDLGGTYTVSELRYLPRNHTNARILSYVIFVSSNGTNWTQVATGTWASNTSEKTATFSAQSNVSYIALRDVGSGNWTCVAEINVVGLIGGADTQAPSVPTGLVASSVASVTVNLDWTASSDNVGVAGYNVYTDGSNPMSVTQASVTVSGLTPNTGYSFTVSAYDAASNESSQSSSVGVTTAQSGGGTPGVLDQSQFSVHYVDSEEIVGENAPATYVIDGNVNTFWHSKWYGGQDVKPHEIQIDLGDTYTVSELSYLPRQDAYLNGTILTYEVYVSSNGTNWTLVDTGTWGNNHNEKTSIFSEVSGINYIRLRDVGTGNLTSGAEINVIGY